MVNGGGGVIYPQAMFDPITLEPEKSQTCAFVTFPEYGLDIKRHIWSNHIRYQKSKMAAPKPEMISTLVVNMTAKYQATYLKFYAT
jgi:hypothetical protein